MKISIPFCDGKAGRVAASAAMAASALFLFSGCATPDAHSFNQDYSEDLSTQPKYYIHDETDHHFLITVDQGVPSTLPERMLDVKTAASAVAKKEADRLGWTKWHMDYIKEQDQGWMHVVVAEVTLDDKTGN
jgi:hypothetical protein